MHGMYLWDLLQLCRCFDGRAAEGTKRLSEVWRFWREVQAISIGFAMMTMTIMVPVSGVWSFVTRVNAAWWWRRSVCSVLFCTCFETSRDETNEMQRT